MSEILGDVSRFQMSGQSREGEIAGKVGQNLDAASKHFFEVVSKEDASMADIAEAQERMQKAQRIYSTMTNILQALHDMAMTVIRNIRGR